MLLAYLDEIGSTGAFIHPSHERFSDSPAFGYGGFVIDESNAWEFGSFFAAMKKEFFAAAIPPDQDPGRWEKKGADLLFAKVNQERPQNLRLLGTLISKLRQLGGSLFYYADEKPIGSNKQTNCGPTEMRERELSALRETLNRLARHADREDQPILVMMDQINEKSRKQRLPEMYAHIFSRATQFEEMRRILEPPMHIDSQLSSNIQFADWVCALVKRAIEYQLVADSRYYWLPRSSQLAPAKGAFTYNSKLRLYERDTQDLHHSEIMYAERPVIESGTLGIAHARKWEAIRQASFGN